MAQEAAKAVGGKVVAPLFNEEERARGLTDFNYLHQSSGLEEVTKQVEWALEKYNPVFRVNRESWRCDSILHAFAGYLI